MCKRGQKSCMETSAFSAFQTCGLTSIHLFGSQLIHFPLNLVVLSDFVGAIFIGSFLVTVNKIGSFLSKMSCFFCMTCLELHTAKSQKRILVSHKCCRMA